jgi:hypothetical protein
MIRFISFIACVFRSGLKIQIIYWCLKSKHLFLKNYYLKKIIAFYLQIYKILLYYKPAEIISFNLLIIMGSAL